MSERVSIREAMQILGVQRAMVWRFIQSGRLQKLAWDGRSVALDLEQVKALRAEREAQGLGKQKKGRSE